MLGTSIGAQAASIAAPATEISAENQNEIKITVKGNTLRVTAAAGQTLEIFSVTGSKVRTIKIGANDETVNTGLPRGCYIVKVGDVVRKVSLS